MASAERWGTVRLNFDYILRSNEPITLSMGGLNVHPPWSEVRRYELG